MFALSLSGSIVGHLAQHFVIPLPRGKPKVLFRWSKHHLVLLIQETWFVTHTTCKTLSTCNSHELRFTRCRLDLLLPQHPTEDVHCVNELSRLRLPQPPYVVSWNTFSEICHAAPPNSVSRWWFCHGLARPRLRRPPATDSMSNVHRHVSPRDNSELGIQLAVWHRRPRRRDAVSKLKTASPQLSNHAEDERFETAMTDLQFSKKHRGTMTQHFTRSADSMHHPCEF